MEIRQEAEEYEARLADVVSVVRDTIRRRWIMLLGVAAVILIGAIVFVSQITPQYVATAKVRLDPGRNPLAKDSQSTRAELAPEAIETEVSAIRSSDLARAIVKAKGLVSEPEFAKALSQSSTATLVNSNARPSGRRTRSKRPTLPTPSLKATLKPGPVDG
jgi:succinoglycan biosynthesis transport protein ExoP